jgi:hypothetical protein
VRNCWFGLSGLFQSSKLVKQDLEAILSITLSFHSIYISQPLLPSSSAAHSISTPLLATYITSQQGRTLRRSSPRRGVRGRNDIKIWAMFTAHVICAILPYVRQTAALPRKAKRNKSPANQQTFSKQCETHVAPFLAFREGFPPQPRRAYTCTILDSCIAVVRCGSSSSFSMARWAGTEGCSKLAARGGCECRSLYREGRGSRSDGANDYVCHAHPRANTATQIDCDVPVMVVMVTFGCA